jgi:hypothetical protein
MKSTHDLVREIKVMYIFIIMLLVLIITLLLTSCQKPDDPICYICTATDYRGLPISETFCNTTPDEMQTIIDHWEAREGEYHLSLKCEQISNIMENKLKLEPGKDYSSAFRDCQLSDPYMEILYRLTCKELKP